jgi:hypothetical protein
MCDFQITRKIMHDLKLPPCHPPVPSLFPFQSGGGLMRDVGAQVLDALDLLLGPLVTHPSP